VAQLEGKVSEIFFRDVKNGFPAVEAVGYQAVVVVT
jgi:hypothetical protein